MCVVCVSCCLLCVLYCLLRTIQRQHPADVFSLLFVVCCLLLPAHGLRDQHPTDGVCYCCCWLCVCVTCCLLFVVWCFLCVVVIAGVGAGVNVGDVGIAACVRVFKHSEERAVVVSDDRASSLLHTRGQWLNASVIQIN